MKKYLNKITWVHNEVGAKPKHLLTEEEICFCNDGITFLSVDGKYVNLPYDIILGIEMIEIDSIILTKDLRP